MGTASNVNGWSGRGTCREQKSASHVDALLKWPVGQEKAKQAKAEVEADERADFGERKHVVQGQRQPVILNEALGSHPRQLAAEDLERRKGMFGAGWPSDGEVVNDCDSRRMQKIGRVALSARKGFRTSGVLSSEPSSTMINSKSPKV